MAELKYGQAKIASGVPVKGACKSVSVAEEQTALLEVTKEPAAFAVTQQRGAYESRTPVT